MTKPSKLSSWQERFNMFLAFPEDNILDGFATEKIKSFIATEINRAKREAEIKTAERFLKLVSGDEYIDNVAFVDVTNLANQIINQSEEIRG